jgi:hypothetical protein
MTKHLPCIRLLILLLALSALIAHAAPPASPSAPAPAQAADPAPEVQKTFDKLLSAIKANDRDAFVADATDAVKQGLTPQVMEGVNKQLSSRLTKGYEAQYLCALKQVGHQVHLWKLTFTDGGDDVVIRLALKDGKVAGFFLQ